MLQNDAGGESHGWGAIGQQVYQACRPDLGLAGEKREGVREFIPQHFSEDADQGFQNSHR